jgi:hypothetical protein
VSKVVLSDAQWAQVVRDLGPGSRFGSLTGKGDYEVVATNDTGLTCKRAGKASTFRVTRPTVAWGHQRLQAGIPINKQANRPAGGLSYTVATEAGAVAALKVLLPSLSYDHKLRVFHTAEMVAPDPDCPQCGWGKIGCAEERTGCAAQALGTEA